MTYRRWESGDGEPSLSQLRRLADVLGVTVAWLATGEGEAMPHERPTYDELLATIAWQAGRIREMEAQEGRAARGVAPTKQDGTRSGDAVTPPTTADDAAVAAIRRLHPGQAACGQTAPKPRKSRI